jgi:hypothetical protein
LATHALPGVCLRRVRVEVLVPVEVLVILASTLLSRAFRALAHLGIDLLLLLAQLRFLAGPDWIADWADSEEFPVEVMCDQLGVSRSGYYAWRSREVSDRARTDAGLTAVITAVHRRLRGQSPRYVRS